MTRPREALGLVVPVYDEATRFSEFAKLLVEFVADQPDGSVLLFVDDGSTDATPDLAQEVIDAHPEVDVRLLRRHHEGKGAAVAAGLSTLMTPLVGFCDLDLSTPLDHFQRIVDAARVAPVLAIGSRDLASSRVLRPESRARETLGRAYNRLIQAVISPGIVDTQCGAKVATADVWDAVLPLCHEKGFAWDAEAVGVALALGITVQEVPIEWQHDPRSKVRVVRDGLRMVQATPRLWRSAQHARAVAVDPRAGQRGAVPAGYERSAAADQIEAADPGHWWLRSKAALVATALRRTAPAGRAAEVGAGWLVDSGGGNGAVTHQLGWSPDHVAVLDASTRLTAIAAHRFGLGAAAAEVEAVPLRPGCAAVVCLLDVVEHLDDPVAAIAEATRLLEPCGRVVITVPAHEWLWSEADERIGHRTRYNRPRLDAVVRAAGLEPVLLTHVFGWLVPPAMVVRRLRPSLDRRYAIERPPSRLVDRLALGLTALERLAVGRVSSPLGTSVLCVARRA